jgi:hypothetical protein
MDDKVHSQPSQFSAFFANRQLGLCASLSRLKVTYAASTPNIGPKGKVPEKRANE